MLGEVAGVEGKFCGDRFRGIGLGVGGTMMAVGVSAVFGAVSSGRARASWGA